MKYQIAEYAIDTLQYRVSREGAAVPVEPKVFDLLVYLIRHRDRVVSRDELFQKVWDGREVTDTTLSNHVKSARKVLGDNGEQQQTILTVRGRGYQFIAPVVETPNGSASQEQAPAVVDDATRPGLVRWRLLLTLAGLLLCTGLAAWHFRAPSGPAVLLVAPFGVSKGASAAWQDQADATTGEVTRKLQKVEGIRTYEPAVSALFRNDKTHEFIRRKLPEAQYVLDGVLEVTDNNAQRFSIHLNDLNADKQVWTRDYYFPGSIGVTGLADLQPRLAAALSESVQVTILDDEQRALAQLGDSRPANRNALRFYVSGWKDLQHHDQEHLWEAIKQFDKAIEQDDMFYGAHMGRGEAYRWLFGYYEVPADMFPEVEKSLQRALALRPDSVEALSALGLTYAMVWKWDKAWDTLTKAKGKDANHPLTNLGFALYYSALGERALVRQALNRAAEHAPANAELADWGNVALYMVGEDEEARKWANAAMKNHPNEALVFSDASIGAYIRGETAKAVEYAKDGYLAYKAPVTQVVLAQAYAKAGMTEEARRELKAAESAEAYTCPYETAVAHLLLGDKDTAVKYLQKAVPVRANCMMFMRFDPRLKSLREDPRYQTDYLKLLDEVGLDDARLEKYSRETIMESSAVPDPVTIAVAAPARKASSVPPPASH